MPATPREGDLLRLFEMSSDLLAIADANGYITELNPAWTSTLGWSAKELRAKPFLEFVHPDDVDATREVTEQITQGAGDVVDFENRYRCRDGSYRWLLWSAHTDGRQWYAVAKDITERKKLEARSRQDPLTSLPPRSFVTERVLGALEQGSLVVCAQLDVDRLKSVNDGFGRLGGDQLLRIAAARLRGALRATDVLTRLGGDEFFVATVQTQASFDAGALGERLMEVFAEPFVIGGDELEVTASIGVAASNPGSTPDDLIHEADLAMQRAKEAGGGCWRLFDESARRETAKRRALESGLRHAVENDELVLHYEPIVSLQTLRPVAYEALVRWLHPSMGLLPPAEFIPMAEENGQINAIGTWVLQRACRQAQETRSVVPGSMSVNVSPVQLSEPGFADHVAEICLRAGLRPEVLCLEITESSLLEDLAGTVPILDRLRAMGTRIAIDDFGMGASSLSYLKSLPVDVIKVDRYFVSQLSTSRKDRAILQAIVTLAEGFEISVVGEGVETEEQAAELRALRCPLAQGFLFYTSAPAGAKVAPVHSTEDSGRGRWRNGGPS